MKKLLILSISAFFALNGGAQEKKTNPLKAGEYQINGQITGDYNGYVYLVSEEWLNGPQHVLDSCLVEKGAYRFKGVAPKDAVIHFIKSKTGDLSPIFLEPGTINVKAASHFFLGAETSGTINNNLWTFYNMQHKFVQDSVMKGTTIDWMRVGRGTQEHENAEFERRSKLIERRWLDIQRSMVKNYNNEAFAPFISFFEMKADVSLDELKAIRKSFAANLDKHPYSIQLEEYIANMEFKIGMEAPAFDITGMDGKNIELKDYKGKYVLIDFWASWCGPCLREMPNVKKLYNETRGKNFEIIGISLDTKEDAWKASVKAQDLKWAQACDLLMWGGPVAKKYNVHAIPRTILIDPQGKVIGIDLRGEELANKVKSLLKMN